LRRWRHEKVKNVFSEVRECAVRMVLEPVREPSSLQAAIESVSTKISCVPQTLHEWVRRHETDAGACGGTTIAEHQRIKALEREHVN
jgi:transposase